MRDAMEARRAAKKAGTKGKKRKAAEMQNGEADAMADIAEHKKPKMATVSTIPRANASIATVTRKVTESLAEEESKRKGRMSDAVASLYGPKDGSKKKKETFMTMGTFTRVSFPPIPPLFVIDAFPVCIDCCLPMRLHNTRSFLNLSVPSCFMRLWLNRSILCMLRTPKAFFWALSSVRSWGCPVRASVISHQKSRGAYV
jgi:hypothetical protein